MLVKMADQVENEGDPPPVLVRSIQRGFRRYAVRKGSVRSTQKCIYFVSANYVTFRSYPYMGMVSQL